MKQLFIGLLVVAAGAGAYYFLQQTKTQIVNTPDKELLQGKWKMDSRFVSPKKSANGASLVLLKDSSFHNQVFDFQKSGAFLRVVNDSAKVDTSYYAWDGKSQLLIKESLKDSTGQAFLVSKLNSDSLILQSKDSAVFVFTRLE